MPRRLLCIDLPRPLRSGALFTTHCRNIRAKSIPGQLPWPRRRLCINLPRRVSIHGLSGLRSASPLFLPPMRRWGGPRAQAPPFTFNLSWGICKSAMAAMATTAKASFTSNKSTSATVQPTFSSTFLIAPTGAVVNQAGSCAWLLCPWITANGLEPRALASACSSNITAAAPSEIELEVAAVTLPPLANTGLSVGIFPYRPCPVVHRCPP